MKYDVSSDETPRLRYKQQREACLEAKYPNSLLLEAVASKLEGNVSLLDISKQRLFIPGITLLSEPCSLQTSMSGTKVALMDAKMTIPNYPFCHLRRRKQ